MLTIDGVKNYLRADEDDEMLKMMIHFAFGYMSGAIDNFEEIYNDRKLQAKADIAMMELIACRYENRGEMNASVPQTVKDIITQLQLDGVKYEQTENSSFSE